MSQKTQGYVLGNVVQKKGELGVKDLRRMNISLLCKWWWKFEKGEGMWQEIVKKKYRVRGGIAN
jgi:hypothetical protein